MKTITKLVCILVVCAILAIPVSAFAASNENGWLRERLDEVVLGGTFTLKSGETLSGNLWILGGNATLEAGSRVTGDVMLLGGNVSMNGEVSGNINAMGGNIELGSQAILYGDLNLVGGAYMRNPSARIEGQVNSGPKGPFQFALPSGAGIPAMEVSAHPLWDFVAFFFRVFVLSALAVLAVMFWPRHVEKIGQTAIAQPLPAGGIGLLTALIAPIVLLVITITIILIPVTLVGLVILALMVLLGWISIGLEVGKRMAISLKQDWATPVSAGLGTLVFTFVAGGIGEVVPCVGWIVPTFLGMLGFGAVLLTRFGTQVYPVSAFPPPNSSPQVPVFPDAFIAPPEDVQQAEIPEPAPWEPEPTESTDQASQEPVADSGKDTEP